MSSQATGTSIQHSIVVEAPQARAFTVFTEQFDRIKPHEHNLLGGEDVDETVFEARPGGRIYDRGVNGGDLRVGARPDRRAARARRLHLGHQRLVDPRDRPREDQRGRGALHPRRRSTDTRASWSTATSNATAKAGKACAPASTAPTAGRCTSAASGRCSRSVSLVVRRALSRAACHGRLTATTRTRSKRYAPGSGGLQGPHVAQVGGTSLSRSRLALAAACAATMALVPATASANGGGSVSPRDPGAKRFVGEITVPKIGEHLTALQRIATLNDDTREVFSPGYQESLDYVVETLKEAGYRPQVTQFNYPIWRRRSRRSSTRSRRRRRPTGPAPRPTTARRTSTSSRWRTRRRRCSPTRRCSRSVASSTRRRAARPAAAPPADYAGVSGKIALVQRGTCAFVEKWQLAQAAGATGVIIYNEGNTPDAAEPDLRRQPAGPAGDDRGRDRELHARQRAAAGLQDGARTRAWTSRSTASSPTASCRR